MRTHELKCWPVFYGLLRAGRKTFEIRKNDRDFRPLDKLVLREWDPKTGKYTESDPVEATITYLTDFAQVPGYVVLGLSNPRIADMEAKLTVAREALTELFALAKYQSILTAHHEQRLTKALAQLDAAAGKEV